MLAAGSLPRRGDPRRPGFDPFDFFDPFGRSPLRAAACWTPTATTSPTTCRRCRRSSSSTAHRIAPRSCGVRTTPEKVVVGQQVNFDIYGYGGRGPYRVGGVTEPEPARFSRLRGRGRRRERCPSSDRRRRVHRAAAAAVRALPAQGRQAHGRPGRGAVRRRPLFDEEAALALERRHRDRGGRAAARRETSGYRLGDVGQYTLTATVEPRKVQAGEAISIVARLEGVGNVPSTLNVPQQHGVEWLEPNVVSDVEPKGNVVRGFRSFTYVVKLTEAGIVDLGELTPPFYNPGKAALRDRFAPISARWRSRRPHCVEARGEREGVALDELGKVRGKLQASPPEKAHRPTSPGSSGSSSVRRSGSSSRTWGCASSGASSAAPPPGRVTRARSPRRR